MMTLTPRNLLLIESHEMQYLHHVKPLMNGAPTSFLASPMEYLEQLRLYCTRNNITGIICTQAGLLKRLLQRSGNVTSTGSLSDYAGSLFKLPLQDRVVEIVFVPPLAQIFTVSYGRFLLKRYISKLTAPDSWYSPSPFKYTLLQPNELQDVEHELNTAVATAVDIETTKIPLRITRVSYTWLSKSGSVTTKVLELSDMLAVNMMRRLNATASPKILQNGKYDNAYFISWGAPLHNWLCDTATAFHATYPELPKDLGFMNAFFLRDVIYWKDLADSADLEGKQRYCGMDTWAPLHVFMVWLVTAQSYAIRNYHLEFPATLCCMLPEMTGLIRDPARHSEERAAQDEKLKKLAGVLAKQTATPGINANSPVQMKTLMKVFGQDLESTDEKSLQAAAFLHPIIGRVCETILDIRGTRKLIGTYLRTDEDAKTSGVHAGEGGAKEFRGNVLYSLNPHGTETGRLASKEHAFWCGFNIQNIPRGDEIKRTIRAPDGFYLAECDLEQAESRDTGHIAGDETLIHAVTADHDFHSFNASAFFGRPYDSIYDAEKRKTKDKPLRDTAKRVDHGANYNMGPDVLVSTMGLKAIYSAGAALKLPFSNPVQIAEYLLLRFHETYPQLRGRIRVRDPEVLAFAKIPQSANKYFAPGSYYGCIVDEIIATNKITSRAYHHTPYNHTHHPDVLAYIEEGDWTRYCFNDPTKSKSALNSYVAHPSQSLNARTLNEAFIRVTTEVALPHRENFRLYAQIHDSIFFAYRAGHEYLIDMVKDRMEIPVTVRDVRGTIRKFTVPAAAKAGKNGKPAVYWNETE